MPSSSSTRCGASARSSSSPSRCGGSSRSPSSRSRTRLRHLRRWIRRALAAPSDRPRLRPRSHADRAARHGRAPRHRGRCARGAGGVCARTRSRSWRGSSRLGASVPLAAVLVAVVLLAYPSYGILFHELASDSIFAALSQGGRSSPSSAVLDSDARCGSPRRSRDRGARPRPARQPGAAAARSAPARARVPLAPAPRLRRSRSRFGVGTAGTVGVHNGVLYGKYTVATVELEAAVRARFLTDRIVRPENGPASSEAGALVQRHLLTEEPYRSYGVGPRGLLRRPEPADDRRPVVALEPPVGVEERLPHPPQRRHRGRPRASRRRTRAVSPTTVWDLLTSPSIRPVRSGRRPGSDGTGSVEGRGRGHDRRERAAASQAD